MSFSYFGIFNIWFEKKTVKKCTISWVLLLRQIWTVNYYVKCFSDNLSNENKNTGVSGKWFFKNSSFWHLNSFFDLKNLFQITEKMNWKSTIICQNNWLYIIWRSRRTRLLSFLIFEFGTRYEINLNLIFILYQSIT